MNGTSLRALDWSPQGTFLWRLISIDGTPSSGMPRPEFRAGPPFPWNELPKKVESVLGSRANGQERTFCVKVGPVFFSHPKRGERDVTGRAPQKQRARLGMEEEAMVERLNHMQAHQLFEWLGG